MEFLSFLRDKSSLVIAGLIGAIIASWWHKDDLTSVQAWVVFLLTGCACSLYLTGII